MKAVSAKKYDPRSHVAIDLANQALHTFRGQTVEAIAQRAGVSSYPIRELLGGTPPGSQSLRAIVATMDLGWDRVELGARLAEVWAKGRLTPGEFYYGDVDPSAALSAIPPLVNIVQTLAGSARLPPDAAGRSMKLERGRKLLFQVRHGHLPTARSLRRLAEATTASMQERIVLWLAYARTVVPGCFRTDGLDPAVFDLNRYTRAQALLQCGRLSSWIPAPASMQARHSKASIQLAAWTRNTEDLRVAPNHLNRAASRAHP